MKGFVLSLVALAVLCLGLFSGVPEAKACAPVVGIGVSGYGSHHAGFGFGNYGYHQKVQLVALAAPVETVTVQLPAKAVPKVAAGLPGDPILDPCVCKQVQLGVGSDYAASAYSGYSGGSYLGSLNSGYNRVALGVPRFGVDLHHRHATVVRVGNFRNGFSLRVR